MQPTYMYTVVSSLTPQRRHGWGMMVKPVSHSFRVRSLRCTCVWPSLARGARSLVAAAVRVYGWTWAVAWAVPRGVCTGCQDQ